MKTRPSPLWRHRSTHAAGVVLPAICALTALVALGGGLVLFQGIQTPGRRLLQVTTTHRSVDLDPAPASLGETDPVEATAPIASESEPTLEVIGETPIDPSECDVRYFDGRPIRAVKSISMVVTAYSPDWRSCAPFDDGITASGYSVLTNGGKLIAADKRFKFGTLLSVPGYNENLPTPVLDRGGAIKGNRLDVLYPTHEIARKWGRQRLDVVVWEYIDE